jgi:hypothetical protein
MTTLERTVRQTEAVWRQCSDDRVPYPPERGKEKAHPVVRRIRRALLSAHVELDAQYTQSLELAAFLDSLHSD